MANNDFFAYAQQNAARKAAEKTKSPLQKYYEANPQKIASNSPAASGRYSGPNDFANAVTAVVSSKPATSGPAVPATSDPVSASPVLAWQNAGGPFVIKTPELDSAVGNEAKPVVTPGLEMLYKNADARASNLGDYADILSRADYGQLSQSAGSKIRLFGGDAKYDYINDIDNARVREAGQAVQGRGSSYNQYAYMSADEIGIYNYLYATEGKKAAEKFLSSIEPGLSQQSYSQTSNTMTEWERENAFNKALGTVLTVGAHPIRSVGSAMATVDDALHTVKGEEINPYSRFRAPSNMTTDIRQTAQEDMGTLGRVAYNAVTAGADNLMNMMFARGLAGIGGTGGAVANETISKISSALMSSEVMSNAVAEGKEKGYSNVGAMGIGLLRGGISYAVEKMGMDWVLKNLSANPGQFWRNMVRNALPEGLEELAENWINEGANFMIDQLFGTNEFYITQLENYFRENGTDKQKQDPLKAAVLASVLNDMESFATGALSAFGSTAGGALVNSINFNDAARQLNTTTAALDAFMRQNNISDARIVGELANATGASTLEELAGTMETSRAAAVAADAAMQQQGQTMQGAEQTQEQAEISPTQMTPPAEVRSQAEANTIQAIDARNEAPEDIRSPLYHNPQSETESVAKAREYLKNGYVSNGPSTVNSQISTEQSTALSAAGVRLGGGYGQAIADMQGAPVWTTVQQDMSLLIFDALAEDAKATGNWDAYLAWRIVDKEHATETARTLQARGKATRGAVDTLDEVANYIEGLGFDEKARNTVLSEVLPYAKEFQEIGQDDAAGLQKLIMRMSTERGTGTLFKSNLQRLLKGQNAEYLSQIARAQFKAMAHDHIPVSIGDKLKSYQTIAQLFKLTTFKRNLGGNETFGIMDALVGNTFGVALDRFISGKTNARSVGFDPRWFSSTQRKAAVDALNKSLLETALDVDMGTVGNKYDPRGRSFRMNGGPAERFMSRLSQILSYSLSSSDAFFRGAIEAGNTETLTRLNAGNEAALSQVEGLSEQLADYRLFQNDSKAAQTAKAFHDRLNTWLGTGGQTDPKTGMRNGGFGLGDLTTPYATVPANLGVKAFEYSPLGIIKGGIELAKVLKNAQSGSINLQQQHNAVMDISRGVTGLPVALLFSALFKSGIIRRSDDDDDYDVTKARQSEGRRETQWNLDATLRWLQGGDKEWQEGDKLISLNWMEPLNAFLDIGALFAKLQEDGGASVGDYAWNYAHGAIQAFMEMPMIDGLQSAIQAFQYADSDNQGEKLGKFAESAVTSAATGMMPGMISQLARAWDPVARDTSGDTFAQRFANALMNATPGLRTSLPEKLDSFGEPIMENPLYNALNSMVLPGEVHKYAPSEVVQALDAVYDATGKSTFYPDYKAPNSFDYDDSAYELTADEKRTYQESFGQRYNDLMQSVIDSKQYSQMTDEEKATVFGEMRSMAAAEARGEIVTGRGGEYESDYDKIAELSDIPGYYATKAMYGAAEKKPDSRDYGRMEEILRNYGALSKDVKETLDSGSTENLDKLYAAWRGGVKPEQWFKAFDSTKALVPYGDHGSVCEWQKYEAMAGAVTGRDMDVILKGELSESGYSRYLLARNAGATAQQWATANAEIHKLPVLDGNKEIAEWQEYEYIVQNYPRQAGALLLSFIDADGVRNRFQTAIEFNVSPELWVAYYKQDKLTTGKNEKGENVSGLKKKRMQAWFLSLGYSTAQFNYMYRLFNADTKDLPSFNDKYR